MRSTVGRAGTFIALIGASFINIGTLPAFGYADGSSYEELFLHVLDHPGDAALNKQFARDAEARGDIRHAFAALERVVLSSPGDTEAQAEFDRLRNKLMPSVTKVTVEVGANYTSNPKQLPNSASTLDENNLLLPGSPFSLRRPQDATFNAKVAVADERTVGSWRWRSLALASGQFQGDVTSLNTQTLAVESGPVFQLTPDIWLHVAGGGAVVWLDDQKLYDDASASLTLGGLYKGLTQSVTARFTWRDADVNLGELEDGAEGVIDDLNANSARIFDLQGRFVASPSLTTGDLFYFEPHLQVSRNDGNPTVTFPQFGPPFEDLILQRPLFPGDFTQLGAAISYYYPLLQGRAFVGAGVEVYQRWYDESSSALGAVGVCSDQFCSDTTWTEVHARDRQDTYVEPSAHLILPNLFAANVDLRFDYRYEHNASTGSTITVNPDDGSVVKMSDSYENHVAGAHVVGRF